MNVEVKGVSRCNSKFSQSICKKMCGGKGENFESHLNSLRVKLFWNIFFVLDVRRQTGHEPNGRQNPQTSANVRTGLRQERYLKSLIPCNLLLV